MGSPEQTGIENILCSNLSGSNQITGFDSLARSHPKSGLLEVFQKLTLHFRIVVYMMYHYIIDMNRKLYQSLISVYLSFERTLTKPSYRLDNTHPSTSRNMVTRNIAPNSSAMLEASFGRLKGLPSVLWLKCVINGTAER